MHNSPAVPIYPHFVNCVGLTPMAALLPREVFSLRLPGMGLSRDPDLGFHDKTLLQTGFKDTGPPTSKRTRNSSNAVVAFKCFLIRKRHSPDQLRPEETIF